MKPILTLQNIALPQIDFDNFSYSITPEREVVCDDALRESIARYGVLHPPLVREINPDTYCIVAGRKRMLALRSFQAGGKYACLVIPRQVEEVDVFAVLLEEIQSARQLSTIEKALFLQKITAVADEKLVVRNFLPRLGLAPTFFSLKEALQLLALEEPIRQSMHRGQIHETVANDFVLLSTRDRLTLFAIITDLRLSFNYQKKLLHMCRELAGRGNTSITALLDNDEVHAILQHHDANPPQKTKNLMLWLAARHMQRATQAEEEFNRFVAAMQLPRNISIAHTPFFENDAATLSITFPDRKSLLQAWEKIRHETEDTGN